MFLIFDHQDCTTTDQAFQSEALADRLCQGLNSRAGYPRYLVLPAEQASLWAEADTLDEDFDLAGAGAPLAPEWWHSAHGVGV